MCSPQQQKSHSGISSWNREREVDREWNIGGFWLVSKVSLADSWLVVGCNCKCVCVCFIHPSEFHPLILSIVRLFMVHPASGLWTRTIGNWRTDACSWLTVRTKSPPVSVHTHTPAHPLTTQRRLNTTRGSAAPGPTNNNRVENILSNSIRIWSHGVEIHLFANHF